jgi:hypothetical protein
LLFFCYLLRKPVSGKPDVEEPDTNGRGAERPKKEVDKSRIAQNALYLLGTYRQKHVLGSSETGGSHHYKAGGTGLCC